MQNNSTDIVAAELIERRIYLIRGHRVMLDEDLASMYEVETKVLNQAVKRNIKRFPSDFMLRISSQEAGSLRSQIVTLKMQRGQHRKYAPYVFTEQGVAMLSTVLRSERAIMVNIQIMRAFTKLRELLSTHTELKRKLEELEQKYDSQFRVVFDAIKELMEPPAPPPKGRIGFQH